VLASNHEERGLAVVIQIDRDAEIRWDRVEAVGARISTFQVSPNLRLEMSPPANVSDDGYLSAALYASAICHSTQSGLGGHFKGTFYKGWDYLLRAFLAASERTALEVDEVAAMSALDLFQLLTAAAEGPSVTLRDLDRRSEMLRGLAAERRSAGVISLPDFLNSAGGLVGTNVGAYEKLKSFSVFNDHQRKKATCFLMTAHFSGRVAFGDPENVDPMVDYHRMRLLLRLGCIEVQRGNEERLRRRAAVAAQVHDAVRDAAFAVSKVLARRSGLPALDFDVLMWAFARSACRNNPMCTSGQIENLSFQRMMASSVGSVCPLSNACEGFASEETRALWEPSAATENY
jgi:hypothetical protein